MCSTLTKLVDLVARSQEAKVSEAGGDGYVS
jgi:hypothetical protein